MDRKSGTGKAKGSGNSFNHCDSVPITIKTIKIVEQNTPLLRYIENFSLKEIKVILMCVF